MSSTSPVWHTTIEGITKKAKTLIDSGSSRNFINSPFVAQHHIPLVLLAKPWTVIAIDGKEVSKSITHKVRLNFTIEGRPFCQVFYVMPLGQDTNAILGMTWLKGANPRISWDDLTLIWEDTPLEGKASEEHTLPPEFQEFKDVFDEELFNTLPPH